MADDEVGEYYQRFKQPPLEKQKRHIDEEIKLLERLSMSVSGMHYTIKHDGVGGERYEIEIATDRGIRFIDWYLSTNTWQVRNRKGNGTGIYSLARYYNLIPRGGWRHSGTA